MTLGGRAAEEIVFGEVTTGASNDLEKVTATAKQMVMRFGMSEKLGPRVFGHDHGQPFLGREFSSEPDYSDEIAREIDDEIRRIVEEAHQTARQVLEERREKLDADLRDPPARRETIEREEFIELLAGKTRGGGLRRRGAGPPGGAAGRTGGPGAQALAGPTRPSCPARAWQEAPPRCVPTGRAAPTSASSRTVKGSDPSSVLNT